jgi:hypothetical protein
MTRPGTRLRAIAARMFDAQTMARLIDPAIADLQHEDEAALRRGDTWRRRWIRARGCASVITVTAAATCLGSVQWMRGGSSEEQRAVRRAIGFSAAAVGVFAALFVWPALSYVDHPTAPTVALMIWYLVPQALAVALPLGLLFGILLGLRNRTATSRVRRTVSLLAGGCSLAALILVGWVMPVANQSYRELSAGTRLARGMNELTLREIASGDPAPLRPTFPAMSRRITYEFHARLALTVAPLTLSLFAVGVSAVRRRVYGPGLVGAAASLWALGYYTVMFDAREAIYHGEWLAPAAAAWAANAAIVAMTLPLFKRVRHLQQAPVVTMTADDLQANR